MAAAKIVGLDVTPTTQYSSTSFCRFPLRMRSRDRSSSHTATPASESSARFSFCAMSLPFVRAGAAPLQDPTASVRVVGGQRGPFSVAAGDVAETPDQGVGADRCIRLRRGGL